MNAIKFNIILSTFFLILISESTAMNSDLELGVRHNENARSEAEERLPLQPKEESIPYCCLATKILGTSMGVVGTTYLGFYAFTNVETMAIGAPITSVALALLWASGEIGWEYLKNKRAQRI